MAAALIATLLLGRLHDVALVLLLGYTLGALLAPALLTKPAAMVHRFLAALARKLDREQRSIATRVYRGIVAVVMVLLPALGVASLLIRPVPGMEFIRAGIAVLWFGCMFDSWRLMRLWQRAKKGQLPLELPGVPYLFADTHGVIRYLLRTRMNALAVGVIGAGSWYVVGGFHGAMAYLALAACAQHFRGLAFGWAAHHLFRLMDALPRLFARLVLVIAALFAQGARPLHALMARAWLLFVARLFHASLGGPGPDGELPWVGNGTPRPDHHALRRLLTLQLAAVLLLLILLAGYRVYPIVFQLF